MTRIELEKVRVESIDIIGHADPDTIVLYDEDGIRTEVRTYNLRDADIVALRGAMLSEGGRVKVILEVEVEEE